MNEQNNTMTTTELRNLLSNNDSVTIQTLDAYMILGKTETSFYKRNEYSPSMSRSYNSISKAVKAFAPIIKREGVKCITIRNWVNGELIENTVNA